MANLVMYSTGWKPVPRFRMAALDLVVGASREGHLTVLPWFFQQIIRLSGPLQAVLRFIYSEALPNVNDHPEAALPEEDLGALTRALAHRLAFILPFVKVGAVGIID